MKKVIFLVLFLAVVVNATTKDAPKPTVSVSGAAQSAAWPVQLPLVAISASEVKLRDTSGNTVFVHKLKKEFVTSAMYKGQPVSEVRSDIVFATNDNNAALVVSTGIYRERQRPGAREHGEDATAPQVMQLLNGN